MGAKRDAKSKKAVKKRTKRVTKKMQTGSMRKVWNGTAKYTRGGLTKEDLCISKEGKVVSKRKSALGRKAFDAIRGWMKATQLARKQLGLQGFVACKKGTEFYTVVKGFYTNL